MSQAYAGSTAGGVFGKCAHCGGSWAVKSPHWTWYSSAAIGPICEECYEKLSPEERWPYYEALLSEWENWGEKLSDEEITIIKQSIGLEEGI
jgi:hypothetical protein